METKRQFVMLLQNKMPLNVAQLILKMECLGALLECGSAEFLHPDLMVRSLRSQRGAAEGIREQ